MISQGQSFPKRARLRSRGQFLQMRNGARRHRCDHFLVVWKAGPPGPARLGLTVSRKVAGAVGRNRVKRLAREVFRRSGELLPPAVDVLVIAQRGADRQDFSSVWRQLREAFGKISAGSVAGCRP